MGAAVDKKGRPVPITPYAGSWAQSQQQPDAYRQHVAAKPQPNPKRKGA